VGAVGVAAMLASLFMAGVNAPDASAKPQPEVLYVGTFAAITTPAAQTFSSIQGAVNAAKPGDWILIAPGDYHENDDAGITQANSYTQSGWYGGVVIDTPGIHLRGMNRNSVIVDGTLSSASATCSPAPGDQNYLSGLGRNGILVWKASGVSIDNLTVCNFLNGTGNAGNGIWWNGGVGSGKIGLKNYEGSYLTATSTFFQGSDSNTSDYDYAAVCADCGLYGIFSSDSSGGSWNQVYANNFSDSGAYIGACQRACDAIVDNATFENNALGYSGTNSGGQLVIENSTFDNNKEGLDTNTALTGDPPPPQDGECPGNKPISTSVLIPGSVNSCWVFTGNKVFDNNNPDVPVYGTAGLGPTGTGMTISGGRYDTITDNEFYGNDAWGMLFVPYPDGNLSSDGKTCKGTGGLNATSLGISGVDCIYDPEGDASLNNEFSGNGSWGNPSNSDVGNLLLGGHEPENCAAGNTEWQDSTFTTQTGPATYADAISTTCGTRTPKTHLLGSNTDGTLLIQAECDSGLLTSSCSSANYPQASPGVMASTPTEPLPGASSLTDPSSSNLASMPNPCSGVPANLWCPGGSPA